MRFGYTIIYVPDVRSTVEFYERAFGLMRRFIAEDGSYAELETGTTALAFASDALGAANLPDGYALNRREALPAGIEIALVTEDVNTAYTNAIAAGADALVPPKHKPWGQLVAYVRDLNGVLIELCSPMS
jgi:uncharacterized glyoxalase superfamily protein PhnB